MRIPHFLITIAFILFYSNACIAIMQEQDANSQIDKAPTETLEKEKSEDSDESEESEEEKTLEAFVEGMEVFEGIFTLYQETDSGSLHMAIDESQINKEFLYFATIHNGVLEVFQYRGSPIAQDVIEIRRYFDRIEFVKKNTRFQIDPNTTLANGGLANITDSVLATVKVVATSEDGATVLVNADDLFQSEALALVAYNFGPNVDPYEDFMLGDLARDKVRYTHVGAYPENLNVRADYVYENRGAYAQGSGRIADARSTTIAVQHSFVKMPDNDFVPRLDDPRVGYFVTQSDELSSFEFMPYRDFINRFHLVKKDPNAALSEPVEPIVWWIENTTPLQYRDIMKKGILAWNSAFEKAGFKNAIEVKIQPDDATWNAEDVRYNVVRFSNTPEAGFAFGPNFINPRTGQILGGDVMFEQSFLNIYALRGDVFGNPSAFLETFVSDRKDQQHTAMHCSKGFEMREMVNFGQLALTAMNASVSEKREIIEQMLMELMLHEVGHVLGLMHNMKASNLHDLADINHKEVTQGVLSSSVMDYGALVIAKPGEEQGDYFVVKPGPYDDWAIQFGYDPDLEGEARDAHLARSVEPTLMFANDADDMRSPGFGIDPRVNIWDMTNDPIGFAQYQIELADLIAPELKNKLAKEGDSWAKIRLAAQIMITHKSRPSAVISSFIGGVEVSRHHQGQDTDESPYKPVSKETQQRAMAVLREYIFSPQAFSLPEDLLAHAAMRRRNFDHFGYTEDPKLHELILSVQKNALARLLNPTVMLRMSDTQLYGNEYNVYQMLSDLSEAIFEADLKSNVNSRRQMLQHEYVERLIQVLDGYGHDSRAKAATFNELIRIQEWMKKGRKKDNSTQAHRKYLAYLISNALEEK